MTGHELSADKIGDGVSNVVRLARSAQRRQFDEVGFPLLRVAFHCDRARNDGVHAHLRRQCLRQHFCQHDDTGFGNRMRDVARPPKQPTRVREIDDHSLCSSEPRGRRLSAKEGRAQIRVERRVPDFLGGRNHVRREKIRCAIHQNVEPAEPLPSFIKQALDFCNAGKICGDGRGSTPEFFNLFDDILGLALRATVVNNQVCAFLRQAQRYGAAQPFGRPGNQRHATL